MQTRAWQCEVAISVALAATLLSCTRKNPVTFPSPPLTSTEKATLTLSPPTKTTNCQVKSEKYPDPECTPGGLMEIDVSVICRQSTRERRKVTPKTKREVFEAYGIEYPQPKGAYEVDHFIPLGLGGSNEVANLWPETAKPRPGFHEKDKVEAELHRRVCSVEDLSLEEAQQIIVTDWLQYYGERFDPDSHASQH